MNPSLAQQINDILGQPTPQCTLSCRDRLLVAARTLAHAPPYEMTATTVVMWLGRDDQEAFRGLVQDIADEYDLTAVIKTKLGSVSARFERSTVDT